MSSKAPDAFRTIGELSVELGVAQHILRYWETKFPQLRPLQRAGNRRYYRPAEVALVWRIHRLLSEEGYSVRGVQKLLEGKDTLLAVDEAPAAAPVAARVPAAVTNNPSIEQLVRLRDRLAEALSA